MPENKLYFGKLLCYMYNIVVIDRNVEYGPYNDVVFILEQMRVNDMWSNKLFINEKLCQFRNMRLHLIH